MSKDLISFERRLDGLFKQGAEAGYITDTIWVSSTETLRDAILRIYYDWEEE